MRDRPAFVDTSEGQVPVHCGEGFAMGVGVAEGIKHCIAGIGHLNAGVETEVLKWISSYQI